MEGTDVTLSDLVRRLSALDLDAIARAELAGQGARVADQVRLALSTPPGGPHDHPWRESGALHDSIGSDAEGDEAVVGSTSNVALFQEHGTDRVPPRPTFAPIASAQGETIATTLANAIAVALNQAVREA
jgi:phage gpG-like protein